MFSLTTLTSYCKKCMHVHVCSQHDEQAFYCLHIVVHGTHTPRFVSAFASHLILRQRVAPHLYVSPTGGNLRKPPAPSRARVASRASSVAEGKGHLQEDGLEQVTFTSKLPLSLTRCASLPKRNLFNELLLSGRS